MPKVTHEYIDKKKAEIINAASLVFKRKPLYEISMLDVIKEAGLSKGGIYKYYKDIDYVLIELINNLNTTSTFKDYTKQIISSNITREEKIRNLFEVFGRNLEANINTLGKAQFELTILNANNPERAEKIYTGLKEYESGKYLIDALYKEIACLADENNHISESDLQHIYDYIRVNIEGLTKVAVIERCYENKDNPLDIIIMIKMLSDTVLTMVK